MSSSAASVSLVGGVPAFDFANTASGRDSPTPFENLHAPSDLVAWARHAGIVDEAGARRCLAAFDADAGVAQRTFRHALTLRDAIYRIGSALASGEKPEGADLRVLRDHAQRAIGSGELAPAAGGGYRFDFSEASPEAALIGPLALSAIDLLATADFSRIKQCPGHGPGNDCQWLFLDLSKNNSRRWCDMATCGNRTKAKRHRARREHHH